MCLDGGLRVQGDWLAVPKHLHLNPLVVGNTVCGYVQYLAGICRVLLGAPAGWPEQGRLRLRPVEVAGAGADQVENGHHLLLHGSGEARVVLHRVLPLRQQFVLPR